MNVGGVPGYVGPELALLAARPLAGRLVAWDPVAGREAWRVEHPRPMSGGVLTTAGNLVFQGRADGRLRAYRATDGELLWEFETGTGIAAPPVTYAVDGIQYVAVLAGWGGPEVLWNSPLGEGAVGPGRLLAFRLDGTATLEMEPAAARPPPPPPALALEATDEELAAGAALYGKYCARCHGLGAVSGGVVPDLRYASESAHRAFDDIVRGGAREALGMPAFGGDLSSEELRRIQAWILWRARESAAGAAGTTPAP